MIKCTECENKIDYVGVFQAPIIITGVLNGKQIYKCLCSACTITDEDALHMVESIRARNQIEETKEYLAKKMVVVNTIRNDLVALRKTASWLV